MYSSINRYTSILKRPSNSCLILSIASRLLLVLNIGCECKDSNISTSRLVLASNLKKSKAPNAKRSLANHTIDSITYLNDVYRPVLVIRYDYDRQNKCIVDPSPNTLPNWEAYGINPSTPLQKSIRVSDHFLELNGCTFQNDEKSGFIFTKNNASPVDLIKDLLEGSTQLPDQVVQTKYFLIAPAVIMQHGLQAVVNGSIDLTSYNTIYCYLKKDHHYCLIRLQNIVSPVGTTSLASFPASGIRPRTMPIKISPVATPLPKSNPSSPGNRQPNKGAIDLQNPSTPMSSMEVTSTIPNAIPSSNTSFLNARKIYSLTALKLAELNNAEIEVNKLIALEKNEKTAIENTALTAKKTEEISIKGYMTNRLTLAIEIEIDEMLQRIEERDKTDKIFKRIEKRLALKLKKNKEVEDSDEILELEEKLKEILKTEGTIQAISVEASRTAEEVDSIIQKVIKATKATEATETTEEGVVQPVIEAVQEDINRIIQLHSDKANSIHEINHAVNEAVNLIRCDIEESLSEKVKTAVAELVEMECKVVKTIRNLKAKVEEIKQALKSLAELENLRSENFSEPIITALKAKETLAAAIQALKTAEALKREQVAMCMVTMPTNVITEISISQKKALQNCKIAVKEITSILKTAKSNEVAELKNKATKIEEESKGTLSLEKENIIKKAEELKRLLSITKTAVSKI